MIVKKNDLKILTDLNVLSTTEYENGMCIRWYCHVERIDHVILMDVPVFISPGYEKGAFGVLSIHLSVYVCFGSPEELVRFYSCLVFKSFSLLPGEYEYFRSRNRGPSSVGPKTQKGDFCGK